MIGAMDSRLLFSLLVALVAAERLVELVISSRNRRRLLARGGVEYGARHYPWMVLLHALFLPSCALEVWLLERPWIPWLSTLMVLLVAASMALRYWVVHSLAGRWTTRVVCVPAEPLVVSGPYRWLRHPNYLAVVVELAALPLVHGAWLTALVFSLANAVVLAVRLGVEERALAESATDAGLDPAVAPEARW
jgi:methyltransferase